jgi:GNAT superfamily N-acetyltransferase
VIADRCYNFAVTPSERIERNLLGLFRHFAGSTDEGEVREMPGVSIASCGATFHMFNSAFLAEPVSLAPGELERRILTASVHYGARGLRWAFWVNEDKLGPSPGSKAQAIFSGQGLGLASRMPAMMAEQLAPPARPLPELELRPVTDPQTRLAFCHIVAISFRIPFEWCRELYEPAAPWRAGFAGYVGYSGGEAVTTAATMRAAEVVGLYCVGTLPGHERRGYGERIVRHALEEARCRHGVERPVLESTAVGLPLYQRMGFETATHFSVYSS